MRLIRYDNVIAATALNRDDIERYKCAYFA